MKITITKPGNYTVSSGEDVEVVGTGEGVVITMTGGFVWTRESSAPVIHQSGGEVRTFGSSAPVIIMTRGEVSTFGTSAPIINQIGGDVWTLEKSAPVIHKKKLNTKPGDRRKEPCETFHSH